MPFTKKKASYHDLIQGLRQGHGCSEDEGWVAPKGYSYLKRPLRLR
jgi:hypothetical protein